jgi:succinate dehydrogenase / fumarate reductase membrane anchor subunit
MRARAIDPPVRRPAAWELRDTRSVDAEPREGTVDYVLLRVTGLVLSVLVLGHFAVTHFVTDVAHDDSVFVARRLASTLWVAWDSTMLAAALAHGAFGLRIGLADYTTGRLRRALQRAVLGLAAALFVLGALAIGRIAYA